MFSVPPLEDIPNVMGKLQISKPKAPIAKTTKQQPKTSFGGMSKGFLLGGAPTKKVRFNINYKH